MKLPTAPLVDSTVDVQCMLENQETFWGMVTSPAQSLKCKSNQQHRSSRPTKAVLSHDGRADALFAHATPIAASSTRAAASTSTARRRDSAVRARHEEATHATALRHLACCRHGASALVALLLLAVSSSHVDHGCGVDSSTTDSTGGNADRRASDLVRAARIAANRGAIAQSGGASSCWVPSGRGSRAERRTREEWYGGIDHVHQCFHWCVRIVVDVRQRRMQAHLQLTHQVGRHVSLCEGSHVVERTRGVVGHNCVHDNVISRNSKTICETLRQVLEDLAG